MFARSLKVRQRVKTMMRRVEYHMEFGTQLGMDLRTEPRTLACTLACMDSGKERSTEGQGLLPTRNGRCPLGYSRLQIGIISVLKARSGTLAYWQITKEVQNKIGLQVTEGAVRGALERLGKYKFLVRNRSTRGRLKGNTYSFASEPCPYIRVCSKATDSRMESCTQSAQIQPPSKSREIERESLSVFLDSDSRILALTETDIALHWPRLSKSGFGASQLDQIVEALRKLGKSSDHVIEGLTHAEWELEHGIMIGGEMKVVESPKDYVFKALARTGRYRMPKGYVSPEEMAIREATQEAERRARATQARVSAEFEAWWGNLSSEEVRALLPNYSQQIFSVAAKALLLPYFRENILPEILAKKAAGQRTYSSQELNVEVGMGSRSLGISEDEHQEPLA